MKREVNLEMGCSEICKFMIGGNEIGSKFISHISLSPSDHLNLSLHLYAKYGWEPRLASFLNKCPRLIWNGYFSLMNPWFSMRLWCPIFQSRPISPYNTYGMWLPFSTRAQMVVIYLVRYLDRMGKHTNHIWGCLLP